MSYIIDGLGIHYDATAPSELEVMLEEGGWESDELMARARAGIARLREARLSLDNDPRRRDLPARTDGARRRVVIVDQAAGDPTVGFGLAGASAFTAMLAAAAADAPEAERLVVMDPAAPVGRRGHIDAAAAEAAGARLVSDPVTAWSVAEDCDRVYVVSAHAGFEAALAGTPVTCFGLPFYAGWGFTDDRLHLPRRTRRRRPDEVFAAAYLVCSRYFDPYTGRRPGSRTPSRPSTSSRRAGARMRCRPSASASRPGSGTGSPGPCRRRATARSCAGATRR